MKQIAEANSSIDRIKVDLSACDALICELEEALSKVEAHFDQDEPETASLGPYRI